MIKPLGDKVVIQPEEESESVTSSGLIVAGGNNNPTQTAKVIAVGDGITLSNGNHIPLGVNVGDTVMYLAFSGTEVSHGNEDYILLPYRDILAVIED